MSYQNLIGSGILEVLFVLLLLGLGVIVYGLLRHLNRRYLTSRGQKAGKIFSKIILPAAFLAVVLCVRITELIPAFQLNPSLNKYLDASALFLLILFLIRLADSFFVIEYERRNRTFPFPRVLHRFLLLVIYLAVLFIVLKGVTGVDITPLLATSAILTMILGLALQELLGNIISGMSIHLTKSFSKGDWIKSGGKEGLVMDTNWRETRIRDLYSNIVVIPNNAIASEILVNYSRPDHRTALTIPIKVSYASPSLSVMEALRQAASDLPEVTSQPPPEAYIQSYEDFGVSYVLKFWITDYSQKYHILGKVGKLIWYKFRRKGIEIPVPLSDQVQHVFKNLAQVKPEQFPEYHEDQKFQCLLRSSFLRYPGGEKAGELILSEEEIRTLASKVKKQVFSPGEIVFEQGDKGEGCFIVASGRIKGVVTYEEKGKKYSSEFTIHPGEIFGEMSLYTGMPRTASGFIEQETELLEIEAVDFACLLSENPKLAEIIADIVSARNRKNQAFLKKIKELSKKDIMDSCNKNSLLKRMKNFMASLGFKR
ncbi:MAG: mechanosensitive ion channel [Candidatus Aminicenantes bacterium]|nr:mechanosensitive ion channel [Candidatus Aminicenantes bacterium]